MSYFCRIWSTRYPGLACVVLCDNLEVHKCEEVVKVCHNSLVQLYYLPPNTTHFLQPLDDVLFAVYKDQLSLLADKIKENLGPTRHASLDILSAIHPYAVAKAFTKERIVESFKNTGIFPFNEQRIRDLARQNIGLDPEVLSFFFVLVLICRKRSGAVTNSPLIFRKPTFPDRIH